MASERNNKWKDKLNQLPSPDGDITWKGMELLLDKHKPVRQNRYHKYILILVLLLLVIGVCNCPYVRRSQEGNKGIDKKESATNNIAAVKNFVSYKTGKTGTKTQRLKISLGNERYDKGFVSFPYLTAINKDAVLIKKSNSALTGGQPISNDSLINNTDRATTITGEGKRKNDIAIESSKSADPYIATDSLPAFLLNTKDSLVTLTKDTLKDDSSEVNSSLTEKGELRAKTPALSFGIGYNFFVGINNQKTSAISADGSFGSWKNFIPVLSAKYHLSNSAYLSGELQINAPQYTDKILLDKNVVILTSSGPSPTNNRHLEKSVYAKKLFYLDVPVSLNISPAKNFFIGSGIQYSRLTSAIGVYEEKIITQGIPDSLMSLQNKVFDDDLQNLALKPYEWRFLANACFTIKRFDIGTRYTRAFKSFTTTNTVGVIGRTNSSFLIYLRYSLLQIKLK
jgi:hypothetical protein